MTYPLARRRADVLLLDLESLAGRAGMHPQHVRRLVAPGLLDRIAALESELHATGAAPGRADDRTGGASWISTA